MSAWNPRPGERSTERRRPYHAGYSDGFYDYHLGAGDTEPGEDYRQGYADDRHDAGRTPHADTPPAQQGCRETSCTDDAQRC